MLRAYSWFCAQVSLRVWIQEPYRILGVKFRSIIFKARVLPILLSLQPNKMYVCEASEFSLNGTSLETRYEWREWKESVHEREYNPSRVKKGSQEISKRNICSRKQHLEEESPGSDFLFWLHPAALRGYS